jgi:hypothetical protein
MDFWIFIFCVLCTSYIFRMISLVPTCTSPEETHVIELNHPRTSTPCPFIFATSSFGFPKLFEAQILNRGTYSNGSFLLSPDLLFHKSTLTIFSQVDPLIMILGPLLQSVPAEGPFIDYVDAMNMVIERSGGWTKILTSIDTNPEWSLRWKTALTTNFCDSRNVMDRLLIRVDLSKVIEYLSQRVTRLAESLSDLELVENHSEESRTKSMIALELFKTYLPPSVSALLITKLGFDSGSLFPSKEESSSSTSAKRVIPPSQPPVAKKAAKEVAIAKNCMKMTSFFKPRGT